MRATRRTTALAASLAPVLALWGCVEQSPDVPSEDDIKAAKENLLAAPPATMKFPVNADLEGKVTYLGLDTDTDAVTPGKPFTLTHYWKVNEPLAEDWRLFVHLEAPGSKANHLNADHVPINGKYPVHAWKKGDIIRDTHRVSVPQTWRAPQVEIYAGLWKGPLRLKVTSGPHDAENRVLVAKLPVAGQKPPEPKRLVARRIKPGAIKLDGKLDEQVWKDAISTGAFVKSLDGGLAEQRTEVKALWDDKNLYLAFNMEDKDVWTTLSKRDDKLWNEEAVEAFIDADGDGKTYVELQANPTGTVFDSYLPAYRQNQNDFDSGMKVAVNVDGTVDKRDDEDKGWTVEMQIPFDAAKGKEKEMRNVPPVLGTVWRVNFFRLDYPAGKAQVGYAWSPPMVGDFHALDKFGQLVFADETGAVAAAADGMKPPLSAPPVPQSLPIAPAAKKPDDKAPAKSPGPAKRAPASDGKKDPK
jgi:hypothetical protein